MPPKLYEHFYANACHICKKIGIGDGWERCRSCDIAYCSKKHRRRYRAQHRLLCSKCFKCNIYPSDSIIEKSYISGRAWSKFKENCIESATKTLKRPLATWEREMFLFPRCCIICHKRNKLKNCKSCASVSCCPNHMTEFPCNEHACDVFKFCFKLDALPDKYIPDLRYLKHMPDVITYRNQNGCSHFFSVYIEPYISKSFIDSTEMIEAIHSEYITRPLTLLHTVKELSIHLNYKNVYIHLINSNIMEVNTINTWEILLHTELKLKNVYISIIGPKLEKPPKEFQLCPRCLSQNKKIIYDYYTSYEQLRRNASFVPPNVVIGFNTRVHLDQLKYHDIQEHGSSSNITPWMNMIHMLACHTACPLILTSYTNDEAMDDVTEMSNISFNRICHLRTLQNPYSSLRPYRDSETELPVFSNSYSTTYFNLEL